MCMLSLQPIYDVSNKKYLALPKYTLVIESCYITN